MCPIPNLVLTDERHPRSRSRSLPGSADAFFCPPKLSWIEYSVLNRHPNPIFHSLEGYRCLRAASASWGYRWWSDFATHATHAAEHWARSLQAWWSLYLACKCSQQQIAAPFIHPCGTSLCSHSVQPSRCAQRGLGTGIRGSSGGRRSRLRSSRTIPKPSKPFSRPISHRPPATPTRTPSSSLARR